MLFFSERTFLGVYNTRTNYLCRRFNKVERLL